MGSWATSTLPLQHLPLLPSNVSRDSMSDCSCMTFYVKSCKFPRKGILSSCIHRKCSKAILLRAVGRKQNSSRSPVGVWENPDDGSESDYDEDGQEAEESDGVFESDWEEEISPVVGTIGDKQKAIKCEDELAKEIELLLEPEERAILDQNPAPNLEKISTEKWCALHTLALAGQIHFLDQLLESGVSIDSVDKDGRTALHVSVIGKKEAVISHLLRKGANPHVKDKDDVTPLHYAVQVSALQTVKLLIKYNVDVNMPDNEGWTPLHIAMQTRNRDIAKVLLVNGADKDRKNKDGNTPLDLSLAYGKEFKSYDLAKLLKIVPANRGL
ncbi:hypothetical protein RND81_08G173200 [Saponaria officinalis]|uniref:Ankyrin repeat domain-containing protein EMB506, chloroplastic n=1 Tax=Saponaria officinalis TaxID=3572 RepID=A0AAW1J8G7_SAPOF